MWEVMRLKRIQIDAEKCSGCRFCEMICSFQHSGKFSPSLSRVTVIKEDKDGFDYPVLCHHCDQCPPINTCPTGALSRTELGTIRLDRDVCTRCGSCISTCTFKALKLDDLSKPLFCDLCGGEPACVKRCPTGAMIFAESESSFKSPEKVRDGLLRRWGIID
jgi:carbon-monoxide dehydrogenase iron sulfur subunit